LTKARGCSGIGKTKKNDVNLQIGQEFQQNAQKKPTGFVQLLLLSYYIFQQVFV
jgi:hypothetical protein